MYVVSCTAFSFLLIRRPPGSPLFPYTTLFRSVHSSMTAHRLIMALALHLARRLTQPPDRKSTRLNSSHRCSSYAVFCLKKKRAQKWPHSRLTEREMNSYICVPAFLSAANPSAH